MKGYEGTVVFVSHDRYFIDELATKVFEVVDGTVRAYPGNYEEFLRAKSRQMEPEAVAVAAVVEKVVEERSQGVKRVNPMKVKQLEDRLGQVEAEIAKQEAIVADCESKLSNYVSAEESQRVATQAAEARTVIEKLMLEWETVSEQLN